MSPPLVSICIPCHNQASTISEAIDSALTQTYPNVEVVVVDDGSTDESLSVIKRYGGRIRWETGPNRGAPVARNRALALSQGEFVNFLDGDDLLEPEKIARQLPLLLNDQADLALSKGYIFGDGKPLRPKKASLPPPGDMDPFLYALKFGFSTCGPLHRRTLLERVGGFRPDLKRGQETELHLRLTAAGARLAYTDELLHRIRNHGEVRITNSPLPKDNWLRTLCELASWLEHSPAVDLTPVRRHALASTIFKLSIYAWRHHLKDSARNGFARARALTPRRDFDYPERRWYRTLEPVLGVTTLEHALDLARRIRSLLIN
jgi:glycosyltransferase involved in cell wall biosynthesis